ncbi:hypothetical protein Tco_0099743 [Tanacetum coccineum]
MHELKDDAWLYLACHALVSQSRGLSNYNVENMLMINVRLTRTTHQGPSLLDEESDGGERSNLPWLSPISIRVPRLVITTKTLHESRCDLLRKLFSRHFEEFNHLKAREVNIKKQQSSDQSELQKDNATECGVFLMMHMEIYNGVIAKKNGV